MRSTVAAGILLAALLFLWHRDGGDAFFPEAAFPRLQQLEHAASGAWMPMANGTHNAFYMWRWDPLLGVCAENIARLSGLPLKSLPRLYHVMCLLLGVLGMMLLSARVSSGNRVTALACSVAWCAGVIGLWGADDLVIAAAAWVPWLILAAAAALGKPRWHWAGLVSLFLAYRLSVTANQLAILWASAAFFSACAIRSPADKRRGLIVAALCLLPSIIPLIEAPRPPLAAYPFEGHVVPDDGIPGMVRPWLGPAGPEIDVLNRPAIRDVYGLLSLALLAAVMIAAACCRLQPRKFLVPALLLALLIAADTLPPESVAQLFPLSAAARTVPHAFFFPLAVPAAAAAFLFLLLHLAKAGDGATAGLVTAILLLVPYHGSNFPHLQAAALQEAQSHRAWRELEALGDDDPLLSYYSDIVSSPSLHVLNRRGLWIALQRQRLTGAAFTPLAEFDAAAQLAAFRNRADVPLDAARDGNSATRWANALAAQQGGEWLAMRFASPRVVEGVALSSAPFISDYPRGLRIGATAECKSAKEAVDAAAPIAQFHEWEGSVRFTSDNFPYFSHPSRVEIVFPTPQRVQCLLLQQTGTSQAFDWTITELAVFGR